jgi:hypothetical protein
MRKNYNILSYDMAVYGNLRNSIFMFEIGVHGTS